MDRMPVPPRAILFDWDKTLVDNWHAIHLALNETLSAMGHETWTIQETRDRVRESMRDSFPRLFGKRWHEACDIFFNAFRSHHLTVLDPLPGAESALRSLRDQGLYLGIVSNKQGDYLRAEVAHLGWDLHFDRVVGAMDAVRDKPAPEPVHMALANDGPDAGPEVWFVGDAGIDMVCARAALCLPVLIGHADPLASEFEQASPDHHVRDLDGLLALVRAARMTIS